MMGFRDNFELTLGPDGRGKPQSEPPGQTCMTPLERPAPLPHYHPNAPRVIILLLATVAVQAQSPGITNPNAPAITVNGKIVADQSSGGFSVIRIKPHEEYKIINVDKKILSDYADKGEPVAIEGRLPRGAYFLFIDKINGKAYSGGK
jgi:hypothetical protein